MAKTPKNNPSFFQFFKEETCAERLVIPKTYILHMLETVVDVLDTVHLRDQYGNYWPVKLASTKDKWYFEKGWPQFVNDNSIETGDFLFFQYDKNKIFHVKLSGKDGCDKKGVGMLMPKEKEAEYIEVETIESDEDLEIQENQSHEEQVNEDMEIQENQSQDEQVNEGMEIQENQFQEEQVAEDKEIHENSSLEEKEEVVQKKAGPKRMRTKARDHYGEDIFKLGILPLPNNPYFVTKIRGNRRDELHIPMKVFKDHSIEKLPEQATLCDSHGRTWSTKLTSWADGRKLYIGGWASFCRVNFVGGEDLCICEFVKKDAEDLIIQLQVVRASDATINHARD